MIPKFEYVESQRALDHVNLEARVRFNLIRRLSNFAYWYYDIDDLNPEGQRFSSKKPKNILVRRTFQEGEAKVDKWALVVSIGTVAVFYIKLSNDKKEVVREALFHLIDEGIDNYLPQLVQEHKRQSDNALKKPETNKATIAANSKLSALIASQ